MVSSVNLVAVGDLQLGDSPTTVGYGFYSRYRNTDLTVAFQRVRESLADAQIVFGNLETCLVAPPPRSGSRDELQLRGEPSFARALRAVGFTVLNVANNHAVQHGPQAFDETVTVLRDAGIACCGVRGRAPWCSEPAMLLGGAVGVLGYCLRPRQYGASEPPYAEGTLDEICADVVRLRSSGATPIVSLHWGEEFVPVPSASEVTFARAVVAAGAALILGHHPHVVRPVERRGPSVIAYSLGNFIGDMVWYEPFRTGAIFRCRLDGPAVGDAQIVKTRLGDEFHPAISSAPPELPLPDGHLSGLPETEYQGRIAATMRDQRLASYRSALTNLPLTPPRILAQLLVQTLRNRMSPRSRS